MEEKRELAKLKIKRAHQLERKQAAKEKIIEEYGQGITIYLQISEKTPDDLHALTEAYYSLATFYFNLKEYVKAGECYLEGIKNLLHTKLNDDSYRKLTELYINLSDACYESMKQHAGNEAMTNAIKAFGLIQNKTPEEQKIGDPVINFKQFHDFYERELSTDTYLESSKFANHEYLLSEGQLVRQQEALLEQFETISLKEIQQIDTSIEGMLSQLSLAAEKNPFNPVLLDKTPSDAAYRSMAMQLLSRAKNLVQNQFIRETIETYKQVIKVLEAIKDPQTSDGQIMNHLQQQIEYLQRKPNTHQASSPLNQVPVSQTGMGFSPKLWIMTLK